MQKTKFASHRQYLLGLLFSRKYTAFFYYLKKERAHKLPKYTTFFCYPQKERTYKPSKVAATKNFLQCAVIDLT